jgi:hypothetical protein
MRFTTRENAVKIDRIEWWQVNQFVHQEMVNSPEYAATHERWDLVPKFIVRLHTDEGHYGVGETQRGAGQEAVEAACRSLIGADPLAINLRQIPLGAAPSIAYKAIEVAVFDLVGRIRAMSMSQLLGWSMPRRGRHQLLGRPSGPRLFGSRRRTGARWRIFLHEDQNHARHGRGETA